MQWTYRTYHDVGSRNSLHSSWVVEVWVSKNLRALIQTVKEPLIAIKDILLSTFVLMTRVLMPSAFDMISWNSTKRRPALKSPSRLCSYKNYGLLYYLFLAISLNTSFCKLWFWIGSNQYKLIATKKTFQYSRLGSKSLLGESFILIIQGR